MNEIVIIGAGYTGTTAAVSLARPVASRDDTHVTLVNPESRFTERLRLHQITSGQQLTDLQIRDLLKGTAVALVQARARLHTGLARLNVQVRDRADIVKVMSDGVALADGEVVPAQAVLWTTGVRVSPIAAAAGLQVDERGRIVTDESLRSVSHPNVDTVGHAATSISRELKGKQPKKFRFGYIHQPVSQGRRDAVIQFTHADDSPGRFHLAGRWAVAYKETVSSSPWPTYRLLKSIPATGKTAWRRGGRATR
jgi:NADH:ubiquinone reductase (H+-translocating)